MEEESAIKPLKKDFYPVDKLVGIKIDNGKKLYRVRWKGYGQEEDTYEPSENLAESCQDMMDELDSKLQRKKLKKPLKNTTSKAEASSPSPSVKDTYWRDFDEGKIGVSDQDMYSKVKERASRSVTQNESSKSSCDASQNDNEPSTSSSLLDEVPKSPLVYPTVVLKRRTNMKNGTSTPIYRSTIQMKPKKKKRYDVLRDYRKRRSRSHKKHNVDENKNMHRVLSVSSSSTDRDLYQSSLKSRISGSKVEGVSYDNQMSLDYLKVLQELPANDEISSSELFEFNLHVPTNASPAKSTLLDVEMESTARDGFKNEQKGKEKLFSHVFQSIGCMSSSSGRSQLVPNIKATNHATVCQITHKVQLDVAPPSIVESWQKLKLRDSRVLCKIWNSDSSSPLKVKGSSQGHRRVFDLMLGTSLQGQLDLFRKLCIRINCVNYVQEENGSTALMVLSQLGCCDAVEILLRLNAHKDIQNKFGETALMLACRYGKWEVVKLLLEFGANFAIVNNNGINALNIANNFAVEPNVRNILNDHIKRMKESYENKTRVKFSQYSAIVNVAIFPIQCFSLNEGPEFRINFCHDYKLSPVKNGKDFWLCVANCMISDGTVECSLDGESAVSTITLNGVELESVKNKNFVFKMSCMLSGTNNLFITTSWQPLSKVKLVVCAYIVEFVQNSTSYCLNNAVANSLHI